MFASLRARSSLLLAATLLIPFLATAQTAVQTPATNRYEFRSQHSRDGIGKFYMGREIAHVMGHLAANWLERPEREREERVSLLIPALKLNPGNTVADIGVGSGFHTRRIAPLLLPEGKVYAVDIQPEMLTLLTNNLTKAGITNVVPVLGTESDPKLPPKSIDLALMVDVYHEFEFPYEMMEGICRALKPGGRVAFVEFRKEDPAVPIKELHKMAVDQVKKEAAALPLEYVETLDMLPWQHVIIFRLKSD